MDQHAHPWLYTYIRLNNIASPLWPPCKICETSQSLQKDGCFSDNETRAKNVIKEGLQRLSHKLEHMHIQSGALLKMKRFIGINNYSLRQVREKSCTQSHKAGERATPQMGSLQNPLSAKVGLFGKPMMGSSLKPSSIRWCCLQEIDSSLKPLPPKMGFVCQRQARCLNPHR